MSLFWKDDDDLNPHLAVNKNDQLTRMSQSCKICGNFAFGAGRCVDCWDEWEEYKEDPGYQAGVARTAYHKPKVHRPKVHRKKRRKAFLSQPKSKKFS